MTLWQNVSWVVECDNDCGVLTTVSGEWNNDQVIAYLRTYGWRATSASDSRDLEDVTAICPGCTSALAQ